MAGFNSTPKFILKLIHFPPRIAYALGLGPLIGRMILLLTTTGRRSGKPRVTPLQYEEIDGKIVIGAALGKKADWVRNIQANPTVQLRVKSHRYTGQAQIIEDTRLIADFLEIRLERHPRMIGSMLRGEGMKAPFSRCDLERYARELTVVVIEPENIKRPGA